MDETRLTEIFLAIVDEYDAQPDERRSGLLHIRSMGHEGFNGWGSELPAVVRDDLDYLHDGGMIDIDYGSSGSYIVKPTLDGIKEARRIRRERKRAEQSSAVDLDWATVRPVLHAVVDVWQQRGAPDGHLPLALVGELLGREPDDLALVRGVELLAETDWVEVIYGAGDLPSVKPTIRGVMATRGWPGGNAEVAAERLLTALDELAQSGDIETRGWAARARDTLMEVGTKTLAEVVSKSVGTAV